MTAVMIGEHDADAKKWEQEGYNAFAEMWVETNELPTLADCPGRFIKRDKQRFFYMRGWRRARMQCEGLVEGDRA